MHIPPPEEASFSENVQSVTIGEEEELYIPPPSCEAVLPENVQFVTVGEDE